MFRVIICLLTILIIAQPIQAQQTAEPSKCDPSPVIAKANALKASGDNKADVKSLRQLASEISVVGISCDGYKFEDKGTKIAGPFVLVRGVYRIRITTKGSIKLQDLSMEGTVCEAGQSQEIFSDYASNDKTIEADIAYNIRSASCKIVFQVSSSNPWTILIEPLA